MKTHTLRYAATLLLLAAPLRAQVPAAAPATPRATDRLAVAYLTLEYVMRDLPPEGEAAESANRSFDRASVAFFGGRMNEAFDSIAALTARLQPDSAGRARAAAAAQRRYDALPPLTRRIATGAAGHPARIHVPRGNGPFPVVIALHGLGGSEHMFMEAYGAGVLRQMADEQGFIAVAPRTSGFTAAVFDSLLAQLGREVPVDTTRIFVIGHSMGGAAAWSLARQRTARIAAVACIASPCGSAADSAPLPPALSVAGALDPIATPARVDSAAALGIAAGREIEYVLVEGFGHTMVVGGALPGVVTWLMNHRLGSAR